MSKRGRGQQNKEVIRNFWSNNYSWIIGIYFISTGILAIFNSVYYNNLQQIFWLCYGGVILIGLGIVMRRGALILSQFYILAIPDIVWSFDFISYLIGGSSLLGIVDYFFVSGPILPKIASIQHLLTVPLSLYVLLSFKIKSNYALAISIFQLVIYYFVTRGFTDPVFNVNCVYFYCGNLVSKSISTFEWIILSFFMVILTYFAVSILGAKK